MGNDALAEVGKKALEDPEFWRELRADPRAAVQRAGYTLDESDMRVLEEAVSSNRVVFDLDEFMKGAHDMSASVRWRSRWLGRWPGRWPPYGHS
jgi:hypothetical protein